VTLVTADGQIVATFGDLYGANLSLDELPSYLPKAVMAIEDRRFYSHPGIDARGLARAMWVNLRSGKFVQGGSTITQQLVKNRILTKKRDINRKVREMDVPALTVP